MMPVIYIAGLLAFIAFASIALGILMDAMLAECRNEEADDD